MWPFGDMKLKQENVAFLVVFVGIGLSVSRSLTNRQNVREQRANVNVHFRTNAHVTSENVAQTGPTTKLCKTHRIRSISTLSRVNAPECELTVKRCLKPARNPRERKEAGTAAGAEPDSADTLTARGREKMVAS